MLLTRPPTPPSASSECDQTPKFIDGFFILIRYYNRITVKNSFVKFTKIHRSRIFYIQTITFGMALALQWSIFITTDKMFSKLNYTDKVNKLLYAQIVTIYFRPLDICSRCQHLVEQLPPSLPVISSTKQRSLRSSSNFVTLGLRQLQLP